MKYEENEEIQVVGLMQKILMKIIKVVFDCITCILIILGNIRGHIGSHNKDDYNNVRQPRANGSFSN